MSRRGAVPLLLAALLTGGCASPDGIAPRAQPLDAATLGLAGAALPLAPDWWRALGDPALDALVERALAGAPALRAAEARIGRARALAEAAGTAGDVHAQLGADLTRQRFSATSIYPPPLGGSVRTLASTQLGFGWSPDLFGRQRATLEAAVGAQRAAEADAQAARQLLAGQVASAWVQLARLQAQRALADAVGAQREAVRDLVRQRHEAGLDAATELRQAEGPVPDARLQRAQLDEQIERQRHALAALTGQPPSALDGAEARLAALSAPDLPAALPSDLLARRADLAAARWRAEAAAGTVRAARAAFYPSVDLTAFVGLSSIGLDRLLQADSRQAGAGPALRLPLFDQTRLRAELGARAAEVDAAVQAYNGAVLDAVRDVADELGSVRAVEAQRAEQARVLQAAEAARALAAQRFEAGLGSRLPLLQAEAAVLAQRRGAVDLQARALAHRIALAVALGGGWQDPSPALAAR